MGEVACAGLTGTLDSFGSLCARCEAAASTDRCAWSGVVGSTVWASVTVAARETAFLVAGSLWLWVWPSSTPLGWMCEPSGR